MADKKKKPNLTPEAAKILEQYRNAGKTRAGGENGASMDEETGVPGQRPTAPPSAASMRRSGTRGK